jgi:hypothetical protein
VRLVAFPEPARPEDYAAAAEELEAQLGELPGLVAVYRLGSVSAPGISDLDRVAVVDGEHAVTPVWSALSDRTRALAMHSPFLADTETFANHKLIAHLEPLELVFGTAVEIGERPAPAYLERLLAAESLVLNLLRIVKSLATGRLKVRAALCQLNTVRHGLTLGGLDRGAATSGWQVADEIRSLREDWFDAAPESRERRLRGVTASAVPALSSALDALASLLPDTGRRVARPLAIDGPWASVTLTSGGDRPTPLPDTGGGRSRLLVSRSSKTAEAWWRLRRHAVALPAEVLLLLAGQWPPGYAGVSDRRAALLTRYRAFLSAQPRDFSSIAVAPPLHAR